MGRIVLVVGGGGREHALTIGLLESSSVSAVHVAPGNAGTGAIATNHPISAGDVDGQVALAQSLDADLVVVGPEAPLVNGLSDALRAVGIPSFGPHAAGAMLEGSKDFAKQVMLDLNIPTAGVQHLTEQTDLDEAADLWGAPWVVKRDVLAGGKGVVVTEDRDEALEFIRDSIQTDGMVLLEEFLAGEEASMLVMMDESGFVALPCSQDHKRVGEGDVGLNTGGMGAYAPAPVATEAVRARAISEIVEPMHEHLSSQETPYRGCLYVGLMIDEDGAPSVVEYNVRFGDPETQVTVPLIASDLYELLLAVAEGRLAHSMPTFSTDHALTVVLAADGYPGPPVKGRSITGDLSDYVDSDGRAFIHHAGTGTIDEKLVSTGGRVLASTGIASSLSEARNLAYQKLSDVQLEGSHFRRDIGHRAL
ncbi:MAG TPA: phosphoribosylamine--glycine ligase [Candidatus Thalassarchaeaceae archaeon]|jgi:phosphoribosylamine--glycine ligase|nr:phosphoribosylamine--glycine ligase [Candidatus Thalassarchaeaceae archaeon]MDP6845203.1 phosphoribosylamine--glycine ligase [Candidatus Thalassarchaeaceae archaeon]HJM41159.1 phosphoribosylamine--glycine ligase [Candidatus Thalassarchaeaceae archaeon]